MNVFEAVAPIMNHRLALEDASLPMRAEQARVIVLWDDNQTIDRHVPPPALAGLGIEKADIWFNCRSINIKLTDGGLPAHAAARMRSVFASHPNIEQVILFGSRAKGNAKPASDIDLALTGPIDFSELGSIDWELDDLLLPWEIDLVQLESLSNPDLREHIARVGQTFYAPLALAA